MADRNLNGVRRNLPDRLAKIRGERSQRRFARDVGIFQQNMNRYESGTPPHLNALVTIALKEKISLDWLILGRGKMAAGRAR